MDEDALIQCFVERNRDFLAANKLDVAHSVVEGKWFVYSYEEKYSYYDYFHEIRSAEEMIDIILQEMSFHLRYSIDKYEDVPEEETSRGIAEYFDEYHHKEDYLAELMACLKHIEDCEYAKDVKFFTSLKRILDYRADLYENRKMMNLEADKNED